MSEAADTGADAGTEDFDAEFEAARQADSGDEGASAGDSGGGEGDDGAGQQPDPAKVEEDKVTKRLRDTQRALKGERAERQKLTARLEALEKGGGAKDAPMTPEALLAKLRDDDDDPIGDIQTVKALAKLLVGQTASEQQADSQTRERLQALQSVSNTMQEYEDDFRELNPDYNKAALHFMTARTEELKDTGLDGQALQTALQNDFAGIVSRSVAAGKDPAEIIYNMAKRRGFASTETFQKLADKLDTINKGQAQSKTLTGGGSPSGALSAGKVAELKGAAFDSAFEKLKASQRRR